MVSSRQRVAVLDALYADPAHLQTRLQGLELACKICIDHALGYCKHYAVHALLLGCADNLTVQSYGAGYFKARIGTRCQWPRKGTLS